MIVLPNAIDTRSWLCERCQVRGLHRIDPVCWMCGTDAHFKKEPS